MTYFSVGIYFFIFFFLDANLIPLHLERNYELIEHKDFVAKSIHFALLHIDDPRLIISRHCKQIILNIVFALAVKFNYDQGKLLFHQMSFMNLLTLDKPLPEREDLRRVYYLNLCMRVLHSNGNLTMQC